MLDVESVQATWMLIVKNQNVHHDEKNLEPIQLGNEEVKASDLRIMNGRGRRGKREGKEVKGGKEGWNWGKGEKKEKFVACPGLDVNTCLVGVWVELFSHLIVGFLDVLEWVTHTNQ